MSKKTRLDHLLVQRGLAETRSKAQALIMAGSVRVGGHPRSKPGDMVLPDADVSVAEALPYVSRGGYKLAHALDSFALDPTELTALDIGASTGGFTDVLLQRGALCVYAVDVGYGQLDWGLRQDERVVVLERTNVRYLEALPARAERTPDAPAPLADCAVIDVSFISLKLVLPAIQRLLRPSAWIVALIKPQFEAGQAQVGRGGVVRDSAIHAMVLHNILGFATSIDLPPHGLTRSPITGPAGNMEFLAWFGSDGPVLSVEQAVNDVIA
ncbi:MAG: TlyA family RNA methyltransferase [Chloroflexi bacterium AL-W]|nr:TlyA family RNA methyltransferase [Chloroflexi bacterium AL-N1]NOK71077.1 TlyA family RNA methyltransferase [Chloroflexi bacterium AL-N10]NOK72701.1 TlyA family RNA methyltransferase [Chloroflexi bacterium AL-N5]NOK79211.1 TlyA family RNA methyltransferase [Chloroflexi bacterium AL-W]NOK87127.1 TlyA family RNA methyltransferase [Chloroflexi bacterium AL-N15]